MKQTYLGRASLMVFIFLFASQSVFSRDLQIKPGGSNTMILLENSAVQFKLAVSLYTMSVSDIQTEKGIFSELMVEGYTSSLGIGTPKVPVSRKLIEIPYGATPVVELLVTTYTEYYLSELGINYPLIPVQPPIAKNGDIPVLSYDQGSYSKNEFSPLQLASVDEVGIMRGTRYGRLNISPIMYNPVTQKLRVYEYIKLSVHFEGADPKATESLKMKSYSPYFNSLRNNILNAKNISPADGPNMTQYPVSYVIIADPMFAGSLQPFVNWKTKKGFNVKVAYTNDPQVGNTPASIKEYLQGLYNQGTTAAPPFSFVLLIGDVAQVPPFQCSGHVSDFYYVEYTGDMLPEAFIGRFSANNESQLAPQLAKTLEYEQYLMPDPSFLNEVVMIGGMDSNFGPTWANGQVNYGTTYYFNASHGLTSHTYLYPQSGSSEAQIIQNVSDGVAFANYTAHGSTSGWADPGFSIDDISTLENSHKYPLMIGNACLTNTFNEPVCFGEALLRAENKGALGYIGGSNSTYWDEDFYWGVGVKTIVTNPVWIPGEMGAYDRQFHDHGEPFSDWYTTQGQIVCAGNLAVTEGSPGSASYYWEIYHLMGDPSLMVYFSVPPPITATYSPQMPLGLSSFTVNTIPYAYAAISRNGHLYGAALADSLGTVSIPLDSLNVPGFVSLVITAQNHQPYMDSVLVEVPAGPFVIMNDFQISDITGNNNGKAENGENIQLNVDLKNLGLALSPDVNATLSSNDPYINITDGIQDFGDIPDGSIVSQNAAYSFTVEDSIPDAHLVHFLLQIQDSLNNVWTSGLSVKLNAPSMAVGQLSIIDSVTGNGNGQIDPGETVLLVIPLGNIGHNEAVTPNGLLSTLSPLVTVNNASYSYNTVYPSSTVLGTFSLSCSPSAQVGDAVDLDFTANSGPYAAQKTFTVTIGLIVENWETGTLDHFPWTSTGAQPWFATTEMPYEGAYCLKSGNIGNQQQSVLQISANVLTNDSISFFRKVSSEPSYDFLRFYIDNVKKEEWSGELGWGRVAFPVTAGAHIFKWSYVKDWGSTGGMDCSWIDFIAFPPIQPFSISSPALQSFSDEFAVFPNPASNTATVYIKLENAHKVSLHLFNALGEEAGNLITSDFYTAGNHNIQFDVSRFPRGVYFLQFTTESSNKTKKLVIE